MNVVHPDTDEPMNPITGILVNPIPTKLIEVKTFQIKNNLTLTDAKVILPGLANKNNGKLIAYLDKSVNLTNLITDPSNLLNNISFDGVVAANINFELVNSNSLTLKDNVLTATYKFYEKTNTTAFTYYTLILTHVIDEETEIETITTGISSSILQSISLDNTNNEIKVRLARGLEKDDIVPNEVGMFIRFLNILTTRKYPATNPITYQYITLKNPKAVLTSSHSSDSNNADKTDKIIIRFGANEFIAKERVYKIIYEQN